MHVIKIIAEVVVPTCIGFAISRSMLKKKWKREAEELVKRQKESDSDFNFDDMENNIMSRIIAYVRFQDGKTVCGCYNATSDYMSPWLITAEDLYNKYEGSIFLFDDHQYDHYDERWKDPKHITDSEQVELWVYGSDFMYDCMASKSEMYITKEWDKDDRGKPIEEWVRNILQDDYSELLK